MGEGVRVGRVTMLVSTRRIEPSIFRSYIFPLKMSDCHECCGLTSGSVAFVERRKPGIITQEHHIVDITISAEALRGSGGG